MVLLVDIIPLSGNVPHQLKAHIARYLITTLNTDPERRPTTKPAARFAQLRPTEHARHVLGDSASLCVVLADAFFTHHECRRANDPPRSRDLTTATPAVGHDPSDAV
jgi:hypothetical protein